MWDLGIVKDVLSSSGLLLISYPILKNIVQLCILYKKINLINLLFELDVTN